MSNVAPRRCPSKNALAVTSVRRGDPTLLIEMLSARDPMTLFPAAQQPDVPALLLQFAA
jgi:hypothetical protein